MIIKKLRKTIFDVDNEKYNLNILGYINNKITVQKNTIINNNNEQILIMIDYTAL